MKIKRKGLWMSSYFINYYDYWNMWEPFDREFNWDGLTITFDGEYVILNGKANSSVFNQTDGDLYGYIEYWKDTTYTFAISYVSGSVTGTGSGFSFNPKFFDPITINSENYKKIQRTTRTFNSEEYEETGSYTYSYYNNLTFNNLVLKFTIIEGDTAPIINKARVFKDRIEAIDFIEI